jgi:hypothetical protein
MNDAGRLSFTVTPASESARPIWSAPSFAHQYEDLYFTVEDPAIAAGARTVAHPVGGPATPTQV